MTGTLRTGQALGRSLRFHISPQYGPLLFLYQTPTLKRYFSDSPSPSDPAQGRAGKQREKPTSSEPLAIRRVGSEDTDPNNKKSYARQMHNVFDGHRAPVRRVGPKSFPFKDPLLQREGLGRNASSSFPDDDGSRPLRADQRKKGFSGSNPFRGNEHGSFMSEEDFVPFETSPGVKVPSPTETPSNASTMTDSERKAFARLQNLGARRTNPRSMSNESKVTSSGSGFLTLDDVLNEAISNVKTELQLEINEKESDFPRGASDDVSNAPRPELIQKSQAKGDKGASKDYNPVRRGEFLRIDRLLKRADTDIDFWNILRKEVFAPINVLKLDDDAKRTPKGNEAGRWNDPKPPDRETVMRNFPHLLVHASQNLYYRFPASALGLCIIPEIQNMGPSAYALGASAKLFNHTMALHFQKYTDPEFVIELLEEMERQFIEPDLETSRLLSNMTYTRKKVSRGEYGEAVRTLWETDTLKKSLNALHDWRTKIENIIQEQELRAARQKKTSESSEHGRETEGEGIANDAIAYI